MSYSRKKSNTEEFIQKSKKVHGEKYSYEKTEYKLAKEKVIITCPVHGDFEITPNNFLQNKGCKKCSLAEQGLKRRSTTEEFIKKAKEIHGNKYDYSYTIYKTSLKPVIILCKQHGYFQQKPNVHLTGSGCTKCSKLSSSIGGRKTTKDFIEQAINKHGDKYDYSKSIYAGSKRKLFIVCKEHGEFEQEAKAHMQGQGCPKCAELKRAEKRKLSFSEFCHKADEQHGSFYKYIEEDYVKSLDNVSIICPLHGLFKQKGNTHLQGAGCKKCGVTKRSDGRRGSIEDFMNKSNNKYDYKFDYSKFIYTNIDSKSTIICPTHGEFEQTPYQHLTFKYGCNKCAIDINSNKCRKLPKELAKLKKNFSRRAKTFLRNHKNIKNRKEFTSILGCSWSEFKDYLENNPYNFKIDCDNLDLDHIVPISNATDEGHFYKLCHYSNFQLLPRVYNQYIKRAKPFDKLDFENWLIETNYDKC